MIFYEAPHKLPYTLRDLYEALGERRIVLCRELTKLYEELIRTTLSEAVARYGAADARVKGEFVLIVEGAVPSAPGEEDAARSIDLTQDIKTVVSAARRAGLSRNEAYRAALLEKEKKRREFPDE